MAYFVADEKLQGYYVSGGVTINIIKYHFECDDAASLPAQGAFISSKNVKISMASTAHTIDTDALYKMDSSGAWVKQSQPWQPLADYSVLTNKPQINGHTLTGNQIGTDLGLQNTLTFDATPTQNSTNPVTSSGIWADQQRQQAEMNVVANAGAKNLLNPNDYIKNSTGGLTITETGTGTYKITGTPSGTVDVFTTQSGKFDMMYGLEAGKTYTISGLPTGNGLLCRIDVSKNYSGSWDAQIISNLALPQTFTVPSDATGLYIRYRVTTSATIPSGGISLEPMIRPAAITDPTFQPYAKTNRELTVMTDEDRAALVEIVDGGAKNVRNITLDELKTLGGNAEFSWSGNVATKSNVSFTINTDGTITVNAEQAASAQVILDIYRMPSDASNMVLSGTPAGGSADSYFQYVKGTTSRDYGEGVLYSRTGAHSIGLVIAQGYRPKNLTFKPMICSKAAWKISQTFQPYRPSWQEMYEMILALQ